MSGKSVSPDRKMGWSEYRFHLTSFISAVFNLMFVLVVWLVLIPTVRHDSLTNRALIEGNQRLLVGNQQQMKRANDDIGELEASIRRIEVMLGKVEDGLERIRKLLEKSGVKSE